MTRSILQTVVGGVLALGLGAFAATWRNHPPAALPASGTTANAGDAAGAPAEAGRPIDPTLAEALQNETGAKRWLLLLSAAEQAKAADMPGLIRAAGKDSAVVRMLGARWAELDPMHMFRSLHAEYLLPDGAPNALPDRYGLSDTLFEQWAKGDPERLVKALTEVPNFSSRDQLRMTVINHLMKANVEVGLTAMRDWSVRHYIPDMKKVGEWADKDPQHAAKVVLELGLDYAGREALKQVGKTWAQKDPEGGLRFALTLDQTSRATLGTEVMRQWATRDLEGAIQFASTQEDPAFRAALAQGLVTTWGKSDPAAALAWSQENLRGTARTEAIGSLVTAAAEKDIAAAADLVASMDPGPAQNRASASVFETWFNKGGAERDSAFEWLASLPDSSAQRAAFERVQWNWMWRDPAGVRDFINGPHGKLASESMISQVARNQAARNPEEAIKWASALPEDRRDNARSAVLTSWLSIRPQGATDYVRKLPPGPERQRGVQAVAQTLIWQSPQQTAAWLKSLPSEERKSTQAMIEGISLAADKRAEFIKALGE